MAAAQKDPTTHDDPTTHVPTTHVPTTHVPVIDVLTIGETMVLVTPDRAQPLEDATAFRLEIGGAESNVACHLAGAGVSAAWASAVGDDPLGRRLIAALRARGVDTSLVAVDPSAPTGVYFKDPHPDGTRVHYYRAGSAASRLGPEFVAGLPLATAGLVHISGITAALSPSCRALLDEVITVRAALGRPVSFDVNYRPALWDHAVAARELLDLARRCDLVFVGRDEAEVLWGTSTAEQVQALIGAELDSSELGSPELISTELGKPGRDGKGRRLVIKDGEVGAHAFDGADTHFAPAHKVDVVEPVGAGDAFAAGYLAADLAGASPVAALEQGHRFAAAVLSTTGDL